MNAKTTVIALSDVWLFVESEGSR